MPQTIEVPPLVKEAMTLSGVCYAHPNNVATHVADSKLATQGRWKVVWGPGQRVGNLAFVAHCPAENTYAVAIRGTAPWVGSALIVTLLQDLRVQKTSVWRHPERAGCEIAQGTASGLKELLAMSWKGLTLEQFVRTRVSAGATLVVTGHSLGGCLATVLAAYLRHQLGGPDAPFTIRPITFAAPTAGTPPFASLLEESFPTALRYYNTHDAVPMAWDKLEALATIFPDGKVADLLAEALAGKLAKLKTQDRVYAQPGAGIPLQGSLGKWDYPLELAAQHHPDTYLTLLGAPRLPFPIVKLPINLPIISAKLKTFPF